MKGIVARPRKRKSGAVVVYYYGDRRAEGLPELPLGRDFAAACQAWKDYRENRPRIVGTLKEAFDAWEKDKLPAYPNAGTRRTYAQNLKTLRPVFEKATWESVKLPHLVQYLEKRSAKTQGNREMALLSLVWHFAQLKGYTDLPYPAAGLKKAKWKNKEEPRSYVVTDAVFEAVYACAEPMLRDAMDLASATGMRLTDCRMVPLPSGQTLRLRANKTGKTADFEFSDSALLAGLVSRRKNAGATHLFLLTMPNGKPVTEASLRGAWDRAREKAAEANPKLAAEIRAMYLRDLRKMAANLAPTLAEASELLQHSSQAVTLRHYRGAAKVRPVR